MRTLFIQRPDDWHVHFRDNEVLQHTVAATALDFGRALVMPNLKPALTTFAALREYRKRICAQIPKGSSFVPYMSLYLNESVSPLCLEHSAQDPFTLGAKLYPAGATTNSEAGVQAITTLYPLLDIMQEKNLVLQVHGEVTHGDIFDRETLFIQEQLQPLVKNFPKLKVVLEHISTKAAVHFVQDAPAEIAATITPQHLHYNRNHLLVAGIKPHYYCLPLLKREADQKALLLAASSGNPKFFAGTDSAPHNRGAKESACGCAGIYSAPYALPLYAEIFHRLDRIDKLNDFTSRFGAEFYQLPINQERIELIQSVQTIPKTLAFGSDVVVPMAAGEPISWRIHGHL